jgi:hypothetical protein
VTASIRLWLSHFAAQRPEGGFPEPEAEVALGAGQPGHHVRDHHAEHDGDEQRRGSGDGGSGVGVADLEHRDQVEASLQKSVGQPPGEIDIEERRQQESDQHQGQHGGVVEPGRQDQAREDPQPAAHHPLQSFLKAREAILGQDQVGRPHGQVGVLQAKDLGHDQAHHRGGGSQQGVPHPSLSQ